MDSSFKFKPKVTTIIKSLPLVCAAALVAFTVAPRPAASRAQADERAPFVVTIPAKSSVEILVNGFCFNRGLPFPGSRLLLSELAPDKVRQAISYGLDEGLIKTDVYAVQLAIWEVLSGPNPARYFRRASDRKLSQQVIEYVNSNPVVAGIPAGAVSIIEAERTSQISTAINDFKNTSGRDNFFGTGTLVVTNLTDKEIKIAIPYGVRFKDVSGARVQDMAMYPLGISKSVPVARDIITGPVGAVGPQGPAGSKGDAGPTGPQGPKGDVGVVGPAGATGTAGALGLPGSQGPKGDVGAVGPTGAVGPSGPQGSIGAPGLPGPQGPQGDVGPAGSRGDAGISCWDRNANSIAETTEDTNGDGAFNSLDCVGATGPTGPIGLSGATGAPGAKGEVGPAGAVGAQGPKGDTGVAGSAGAIGLPGAKGEVGLAGVVGAQGPKGDTGVAGSAGPIGLPGATGATGATGAPGAKGEVGPAGAVGAQGPKGDTGATGLAGSIGLPGIKGAVGANGANGINCWDRNANGVFEVNEDTNGDDKFDTKDCVGPVGATGAQGPKGDTGVTGSQGSKGEKGDAGAVGLAGASGLPGDRGATGATGATGSVGPTGATGPAGAPGLPGPQGPKGDVGPVGPAGVTGPAGPTGKNAAFSIVRVSNSTPVNTDTLKTIEATCPVGKVLVGGGFDVNANRDKAPGLVPEESYPINDSVWRVKIAFKTCDCDPYPWAVTAWAICIDKPLAP